MGDDRERVSAPAFWDGLYAQGEDGWELREPAPPLVAWLDAGHTLGPRGSRVLVPGCGRGHDVRLLARRGYRAHGVDFAAAAVAEARALAAAEGIDAEFAQQDVFTLPAEHGEAFDAAWEYTCFCAIDPARRPEYVAMLHAILKPGGTLLGCFYPLREGTDGPPFPVARDEIERLLGAGFRIIESGEAVASVERRRGLEWMIRAVRV